MAKLFDIATESLKPLPETLYHGSAFKTEPLRPGFHHSNTLVTWDNTESNKFLYATTDRDEAIMLGFASSIEKKYDLHNFKNVGNSIQVTLQFDKPSWKDLAKLPLYLYIIPVRQNDHWVKNTNPDNQIETEWKTDRVIQDAVVEVIDLTAWLKDKTILILTYSEAVIAKPKSVKSFS